MSRLFFIIALFKLSSRKFAEATSAWSLILMSAMLPSAQADARRRSARTAGSERMV
jgi:hypothetical protein